MATDERQQTISQEDPTTTKVKASPVPEEEVNPVELVNEEDQNAVLLFDDVMAEAPSVQK